MLAGAFLPLSGCTALQNFGFNPSPVSRDFVDLHGAYATPVARDLVASIPVQNGQTLPIIYIKGADTAFGTALGLELKQKGYGIVANKQQAAGDYHTLTYVVDQLEDGRLLASITLGNLRLSRIYQQVDGTVQPASPLSIRQGA